METLIFPNSQLKKLSVPVTQFDDSLRTFALDLFAHCVANKGIGMAAPQVGKPIRLIVVNTNLPSIKSAYPTFLVNPRIENPSGHSIYKEGCLSVPGVYASVKRHNTFDVIFQSLEGLDQKLHVENTTLDIFGTVVQHEIDHLDGIEFIDKLDFFQQNKIANALNKLRTRK